MGFQPNAGHYSDREMAYLLIQQGKLNKALEHALAEYNRRPKNNDVNEMMALTYYKRNEASKAVPYIEKAMQTGSASPVMLAIAGLIYYKAGNVEKARKFLKRSLAKNPVMPKELLNESKIVLSKTLKAQNDIDM